MDPTGLMTMAASSSLVDITGEDTATDITEADTVADTVVDITAVTTSPGIP